MCGECRCVKLWVSILLWWRMQDHRDVQVHIWGKGARACPNCFLSPVVATMRDLGKKGTLEAAAGEALGQTLTVAQLDVCSDESVAQCLSCIRGGEVDVLGEKSLGSLAPPWPEHRSPPQQGPPVCGRQHPLTLNRRGRLIGQESKAPISLLGIQEIN